MFTMLLDITLNNAYRYPEAISLTNINKHIIAIVWEWRRPGAGGVKISNIQIDYLLNIAGTGLLHDIASHQSPLIIMLITDYYLLFNWLLHTTICRAWCLCWRTGTARSWSWCSRATSPSSLSGSSPSTTSSQRWTRPVSILYLLDFLPLTTLTRVDANISFVCFSEGDG